MKIHWLILAAVCLMYYGYIRQTTDLAMVRFGALEQSYSQALGNYNSMPSSDMQLQP